MKKLIIILILLLALSLVGILYGKPQQPGEKEMLTVEQIHMNELPDQMPDVIVDPMVGFPLH